MAIIKLQIKEDVWRYSYSKHWSDNAVIELNSKFFPQELVDKLRSFGVSTFIRERQTEPNPNDGVRVKDFVEIEESPRALEFILKLKFSKS